jgi:hypothetical protein
MRCTEDRSTGPLDVRQRRVETREMIRGITMVPEGLDRHSHPRDSMGSDLERRAPALGRLSNMKERVWAEDQIWL